MTDQSKFNDISVKKSPADAATGDTRGNDVADAGARRRHDPPIAASEINCYAPGARREECTDP